MQLFQAFLLPQKIISITIFIAIFAAANPMRCFAHGGEDHGDSAPKTTTSDKGTISRSVKLGEYELTIKHPLLEPDTAATARLFVTEFKTNKAVDNAAAIVEIESANSSLTTAIVEKTDTPGSYNIKIPALPQGKYTVRVKLTYKGETDTATFSGVEAAPAAAASESKISWWRTILITFVFAFVLALFGGLIYFVWRYADGGQMNDETVST